MFGQMPLRCISCETIFVFELASDPNEIINHIDCTPQEFGSQIEAYNVRKNKHLARPFNG